MRIKSLFIATAIGLLFFSGNAEAQKVSVGIKGGLSIPNLTAGSGSDKNPLNEGYSSSFGPDFGIFTEIKFSKLFSLQPEIEYSSQGGKKDGFQALTTPSQLAPVFTAMGMTVPTYLYADYKSKAQFNYLMVPVLSKFGWDLGKQSPFRVYVAAGPFVGFLLNAHQKISGGTSAVYYDNAAQNRVKIPDQTGALNDLSLPFDSNQNIKDQLHKTNVGLEGEAGISYKIGRSNIFIEGGGNYGFLNIQKGTANGKNNVGAGTVMIGYAYDL